jgi:hypothetical protein
MPKAELPFFIYNFLFFNWKSREIAQTVLLALVMAKRCLLRLFPLYMNFIMVHF